MVKIVGDPGHGGLDSGAVSSELKEKYFTWKIINKIQEQLKPYEVEFIIVQPSISNPQSTSNDELYLPPQEAIKLKADFYLSIHVNAGGGTGFESYVHTEAKNGRADKIREVIHKNVTEYLAEHGVGDRGMKYANFAVLRLTTSAGIPSELLECLFIDNPKDAALLRDENFLDGLAGAIVMGMVKAFDIKNKRIDPRVLVGNTVIDAIMVGDRVYAPVRALAEAMGKKVTWDGNTKTVVIE